MTKNQLIKKLQKIKGNPLIVCSGDSDGNGFSELGDISSDLFYDGGEVVDQGDMEDPEYGFEPANFRKCVVLWPI